MPVIERDLDVSVSTGLGTDCLKMVKRHVFCFLPRVSCVRSTVSTGTHCVIRPGRSTQLPASGH